MCGTAWGFWLNSYLNYVTSMAILKMHDYILCSHLSVALESMIVSIILQFISRLYA